MTVTRQRLAAPPEQSPLVVSRIDPRVEAREHCDRLRVIAFFAGRTGQPLDAVQATAATRLPAPRVLAAVDDLVDAGFLQPASPGRTPFGHVRTWVRPDLRGAADAPDT
jgi:hypothetical protein